MKIGTGIIAVCCVCALLLPAYGADTQTQTTTSGSEKPGDIERAALGKADFLVGDWEGEGWSLTRSGERRRFWVKEFFHYRGDKDIMDMEAGSRSWSSA
jgi:hypothetical protein